MRNRSKNSRSMEVERIKEEPHLSGAYIRSLVKQLTSSKSKPGSEEIMNQKPGSMNTDGGGGDAGNGFPQNLAKPSDDFGETQQQKQPHPQPPPVKKQVRRRLHTSRPYQERLLNMAEARREIVTALKFHRASMKQTSQEPPTLEPEKIKSRRNPRIYPANSTIFSDYLNNYSIGCYTTQLSHVPPQSPNFSWVPSSNPALSNNETIALPQQTLGLNLNFNDLGNIDSTFYTDTNKNEGNPSVFSGSSSVSCNQVSENIFPAELLDYGSSRTHANLVSPETSGGILHPIMDDEEMAEIRSLGEQHEMEWNDTVNLVKSACWFKFLKTMEIEPDNSYEIGGNVEGFQFFDEFMEIPAWLQDGMGKWESPLILESCFLHPQSNDSDDFLQDCALPRMELGEFEGIDAEWLL